MTRSLARRLRLVLTPSATLLGAMLAPGLASAPLILGAAAAIAIAAPARAADEASVEGTIRSVDAKAAIFVLNVANRDLTIRIDKNTRYVRDGKDVPMADVVKAKAQVKVVHNDGLAFRIEAVDSAAPAKPATPPAKPPAKPAAPPPKSPSKPSPDAPKKTPDKP
ncbi:MAG: hypothetical protein U0575_12935 [Phycisphaerales bacterium]